LEKYSVKLFTEHKLIEVKSNCVVCENKDGQIVEIPCHYVVMAVGAKPVKFETTILQEICISVIYIGDCKDKATDIENAIKTAYDAANVL